MATHRLPATTALQVEGIFAHPVLALRTLREVKLLAHLQHPNILCLHELYLDGPSFKDGLPMAAENKKYVWLCHGLSESLAIDSPQIPTI